MWGAGRGLGPPHGHAYPPCSPTRWSRFPGLKTTKQKAGGWRGACSEHRWPFLLPGEGPGKSDRMEKQKLRRRGRRWWVEIPAQQSCPALGRGVSCVSCVGSDPGGAVRVSRGPRAATAGRTPTPGPALPARAQEEDSMFKCCCPSGTD